ncbi:MAG: prolipoprotein diacylglyceryl transferase [Frankiaceae bacterium]
MPLAPSLAPPVAEIPSPAQGVWHLGPFPVRAYALAIIVGVVVCVWIGDRRWVARGGLKGTVPDVALWAVPFGLVGGRIYHVITDPELYFSHDDWHPLGALEIWRGGLGIWGAISLGAVGAWIGCRRRGIALPPFADAAAPGIVVAQAIGRWGNYFNQELFGRHTDLPWALRITHGDAPGLYHPTFLYESLWDLSLAFLLVWADRRWRMGHGRVFALYVAGYTAGRGWIEALRVDQAHHVLGLRLNDWTSVLLFAGAVAYLVLTRRMGREPVVDPRAGPGGAATPEPGPGEAAETGGAPGARPAPSTGSVAP